MMFRKTNLNGTSISSQPVKPTINGRHSPLADGAAQSVKNSSYERVVSKPLKLLFPSSCPPIEYFIQYKERLLLTIVHSIARSMLKSEHFAPGDDKIKLEPSEGGKNVFLFKSLEHRDILGLKVMDGTHNGETARVIEIRYKKKTSVAQKGLELEFGEPRMKAFISSETFSDALVLLRRAMDDPLGSPRVKEKLAPLFSALEAERQGQEYMFREACGNDSVRISKAKNLLSDISKALVSFENAKVLNAPEMDTNGKNISIKDYVDALASWPFPRDNVQAHQFYNSLSVANQEFLGYISQSYVTKILPRVFGVAVLEHTALDSISQLQNQLRLINSKTPPSKEGPLLEKIAQFDAKFAQLDDMITGITRERGEPNTLTGSVDSLGWFLKLGSIMESRRRLLIELTSLEKMANELDHELPYRGQIKKTIVNMAFNLCRVSKDEADVLELLHKNVSAELRTSPVFRVASLKNIHENFRAFVRASKKETERLQIYLPIEAGGKQLKKKNESDDANRTKFKQAKAQIDEEILGKILELQKTAPALGDILLVDFRRSKTHVSYKQGETLSQTPENHLTRLRIAQRLYELTGTERYNTSAKRYLEEASRLFTVLWGDHSSRKSIITILKPMRYLQEKGFDIVGSPEKQIQQENTNQEISVNYHLVYEGNAAKLVFSFEGVEHSIDMGTTPTVDAGILPFDFGQSEKNIQVDIYGRRVTFSEVMPNIQRATPYDMFHELYVVASRNPEKFDEIRDDMIDMNMENARFLSTVACSTHNHSGSVARFGDKTVENLPLKLNEQAENTFARHVMGAYHDFEANAEEAKQFAYQQIARRMVIGLAVNKPFLVMEYIRAVLAEKESTTQA